MVDNFYVVGKTSRPLLVMFIIFFVTFPCGILGQVLYLIVSFPDLCRLSYILQPAKLTKKDIINTEQVCRYRRDIMFTTMNIRFVHPETGTPNDPFSTASFSIHNSVRPHSVKATSISRKYRICHIWRSLDCSGLVINP